MRAAGTSWSEEDGHFLDYPSMPAPTTLNQDTTFTNCTTVSTPTNAKHLTIRETSHIADNAKNPTNFTAPITRQRAANLNHVSAQSTSATNAEHNKTARHTTNIIDTNKPNRRNTRDPAITTSNGASAEHLTANIPSTAHLPHSTMRTTSTKRPASSTNFTDQISARRSGHQNTTGAKVQQITENPTNHTTEYADTNMSSGIHRKNMPFTNAPYISQVSENTTAPTAASLTAPTRHLQTMNREPPQFQTPYAAPVDNTKTPHAYSDPIAAAHHKSSESGTNRHNVVYTQVSNNTTHVSEANCPTTTLHASNVASTHSMAPHVGGYSANTPHSRNPHRAPQYNLDASQTHHYPATAPHTLPSAHAFPRINHTTCPHWETAATRNSCNLNLHNPAPVYPGIYQNLTHQCNHGIAPILHDGRRNVNRTHLQSGAVLSSPLSLYPINPLQNQSSQIGHGARIGDGQTIQNSAGSMVPLAEGTATYGLLYFHPITSVSTQLQATHYAYVYASNMADTGYHHLASRGDVAGAPITVQGSYNTCIYTPQCEHTYMHHEHVAPYPNITMDDHMNYHIYNVSVVYPDNNPYRYIGKLYSCNYNTPVQYQFSDTIPKKSALVAFQYEDIADLYVDTYSGKVYAAYEANPTPSSDPKCSQEATTENSSLSDHGVPFEHFIEKIAEEYIMDPSQHELATSENQHNTAHEDSKEAPTGKNTEPVQETDCTTDTCGQDTCRAKIQEHKTRASKLEAPVITPLALEDQALLESVSSPQVSPIDISCATENLHEECTTPLTETGACPSLEGICYDSELRENMPTSANNVDSYEILPGVTAVPRTKRTGYTASIDNLGNRLSKPKNAESTLAHTASTRQDAAKGPYDATYTPSDSHVRTEHDYAKKTKMCARPTTLDIATCQPYAVTRDSLSENINSVVEGPITESFAAQNLQDTTAQVRHISK